MAIITFAASKGGTGKSTLCTLCASEMAQGGAHVLVIDADKQRSITQWRDRTAAAGKMPRGIEVHPVEGEHDLARGLEKAAQFDVTFVDVIGAMDQTLGIAITNSDLCVVPVRASILEVVELDKIFAFGKVLRHAPLRILFNDVDGIELRLPSFQDAVSHVLEKNYPTFNTVVARRHVYREFANATGSLAGLEVKNRGRGERILKARKNISNLLTEIMGYANA